MIGQTLKPSSSIRNGYSLVPWAEPAIFDDPQTAGGNLIGHAMVEQDDAIGDIFFQAMTSEGTVAALAGDDRGYTLVFQPTEETAQLGAENAFVRQGREKSASIVSSTTRLAPMESMACIQTDEQSLEVVFTGFFDFASLDADVIEDELLLSDELVKVETKRATF